MNGFLYFSLLFLAYLLQISAQLFEYQLNIAVNFPDFLSQFSLTLKLFQILITT